MERDRALEELEGMKDSTVSKSMHQQKVLALQEEIDRLKNNSQVAAFQAQVEELTRTLSTQNVKITQQTEQLQSHQEEQKNLQSQWNESQWENEDLRTQVTALKAQAEEYQKKIAALEAQLAAATADKGDAQAQPEVNLAPVRIFSVSPSVGSPEQLIPMTSYRFACKIFKGNFFTKL